MESQNSEILGELDDTLTDSVSNNLSADLDNDLEKFGDTADMFGQSETGFACDEDQVGLFPEAEDGFGCPEDLSSNVAETEESVKALLEQEKGNLIPSQ